MVLSKGVWIARETWEREDTRGNFLSVSRRHRADAQVFSSPFERAVTIRAAIHKSEGLKTRRSDVVFNGVCLDRYSPLLPSLGGSCTSVACCQ